MGKGVNVGERVQPPTRVNTAALDAGPNSRLMRLPTPSPADSSLQPGCVATSQLPKSRSEGQWLGLSSGMSCAKDTGYALRARFSTNCRRISAWRLEE